jgi:imidazolonepropionase
VNTVLLNAGVVCMRNATDTAIKPNTTVVVEDETISWVGDTAHLPETYSEDQFERVDIGGRVITPGLIDCHTHVVYGGNRAEEFEQRLEGVSYAEISRRGGGIMNTVNATRSSSAETLFSAALPRLQRIASEGVTTIEVKSGYGLDSANEIKMLRVARDLAAHVDIGLQTTFLGAHAMPPEYAERKDDYIQEVCENMLPAAAAAGVVDAVDAFCEGIAFSVPQVERVFDVARNLGLPIKCHAEQLSDLGGAVMAARRGALSVDHLEYLNEADVATLAASGTVAVLLPGAFYVLKETKLPPIDALRRHAVPMAFATDCNPGSSPVTSLLLIMNMACTLFRNTPQEALAGVTINAARALGLQHRIGSVEVGKQADLAVWDITHPAELTYNVGLNPCAGVMRKGRWRMPLAGDDLS